MKELQNGQSGDILLNSGWATCDGVFLILYNILTDDTVR